MFLNQPTTNYIVPYAHKVGMQTVRDIPTVWNGVPTPALPHPFTKNTHFCMQSPVPPPFFLLKCLLTHFILKTEDPPFNLDHEIHWHQQTITVKSHFRTQ